MVSVGLGFNITGSRAAAEDACKSAHDAGPLALTTTCRGTTFGLC